MKGFRKFFWMGAAISVIHMIFGFTLQAIWGMLFLIFAILFAILEVLLNEQK